MTRISRESAFKGRSNLHEEKDMADGAVIMDDAGGVINKKTGALKYKGPVNLHAVDDSGKPINMDELKDPDPNKRKHSIDLKDISSVSVTVGGTTVTTTSVTKAIISVTETNAQNASRNIQLTIRD